jgi:hypothetical protein
MTDRAKTSADAPGGGKIAGKTAGDIAADFPLGVDEFAHIPTSRTRHPLVAIAAALLSAYLVFHVRHELRYVLSSGEALDLGDARVTFSPRTEVTGLDNRYVRVRGTPDRESGLQVDTKGSWEFSQFFRVLGTGSHLFVHRPPSPLPPALAENDVFEGRLVRFRELVFEDAVRAYYSAHVAASHFFAPADLRGAVAAAPGGALALHDLAGDPVTLAPDDLVAIDVARPEEVRVGLPRDRFADEASARGELERRGATIVTDQGLVKVDTGPAPIAFALGGGPPLLERWTFVARFDAATRAAALSAIGELDRRVEIHDARETLRVRVADMAADAGALLVRPGGGSERRLPLASIAATRTLTTTHVPDDAYLLVEGDRPRDHLPTLFVALAVATFGVFNLAGLARLR